PPRRPARVNCFLRPGTPSAGFRNGRAGRPFRWRGHRRYVLFDQVPKHCREQEGDQLRAPVFRALSFHNCCTTKFPRYAAATFSSKSQTGFGRRLKAYDLPWQTLFWRGGRNQFLKARILAEWLKHWIEAEQRRSERRICGQRGFVRDRKQLL